MRRRSTRVTEPGLIMGTAGYMSPEQVRGQAADARSDIFAFGAILYEMISGKRAFHGETSADTMSAILKEEVPELSETARNVPAGLERIVRHCLEKTSFAAFPFSGRPGVRPGVADRDFRHQQQIGRAGRGGASRGEESRRKLVSVLGAVALAAAMIGLGWWLGRGRGAAPPPEYQQITFRTGSIGNARFTPDGSIVYDASWEGGLHQLYLARTDDNGSRELGLKDAALLSISKSGELAIRLNTVYLRRLCARRDAGQGPLERGNAARSSGQRPGCRLGGGWREHGRGALRPGEQPLAAGVSDGQGIV